MAARIPQSKEELQRHLDEQMQFLRTSVSQFDSGVEIEAKRIAQTIRILVHESRTSKALLVQLGLRDTLSFFDTTHENPKGSLSTYDGLLAKVITRGVTKYAPKLETNQFGEPRQMPFVDWWGGVVFVDSQRRSISRKELILAVANQDGGAHVDSEIDSTYSDLSRKNSLGWVMSIGGRAFPMEGPHLSAVRQIAHEVLKTLVPGYVFEGPELEGEFAFAGVSIVEVEEVGTDPKPTGMFIHGAHINRQAAPPQSRNSKCHCRSGKTFKNCHGRSMGKP